VSRAGERNSAQRSGSSRSSRLTLVFATICIALILSLAAGELLLRLSGHTPWKYRTRPHDLHFHDFDPSLGWRIRPGTYRLPSSGTANAPTILMRFREDGSRITSEKSQPGERERVYLMGGSFIEGLGLPDDETLAWKLQSRFPHLDVRNYGVGGYGTLQVLLLLKRLLANEKPPSIVLYGLMSDHERRNIASAAWLRALSQYERQAATPYATVKDDGSLVVHGLIKYPLPWLAHRSALARFAVDKYVDINTRARSAQSQAATFALLREIDQTVKQASATFAVVLLSVPRPCNVDCYANYMKSNDIKYVDCDIPDLTGHYTPYWSHPDSELNAHWAECIAASGVLSME